MARILAVGYGVWSAFIALGAGSLGVRLNCEGGEGCSTGFPSWFQPWTWGEYSVYPEAFYLGVASRSVCTAVSRLPRLRSGIRSAANSPAM
jgi:hypothetical protein